MWRGWIAKEVEKVFLLSYLKSQEISKEKLFENKKMRQKVYDIYFDDMNFICQRIDNTFEQKEQVKDLYADLNHKLSITNK